MFLARGDRSFRPGLGFDERTFPEKAFRFIERERPDGEIFNSDIWGGPMILALYPRYRVFIDGRQEVYGEAFWRQVYFPVLSGMPGWEAALDKYGVNLALLRHPGSEYGHLISRAMWESPDWVLVYWDDLTSIYARRDGRNRRLLDQGYHAVDPDDFNVESLVRRGTLESAVRELERRAREDPASWRARLYLGLVYLASDELDEAQAEFQAILTGGLMESPMAALSGLGDVFTSRGLPDSALACYREARRDAPRDPLLMLKEAWALGGLGRVADAEAVIQEIPSAGGRAEATGALWRALFENGHLRGAAAVLESAAKAHPADPEIPYTLGIVHERLGERGPAETAYRRALALRPEFPEALNNLAWLLAVELGRLAEGETFARKARSLSPEDAGILDTLGWIRHLTGDERGAVALLSEAAERLGASPGPDAADVFHHLGEALASDGRREAAVRAFRRAVDLKPDHADALAALRRLGEAP